MFPGCHAAGVLGRSVHRQIHFVCVSAGYDLRGRACSQPMAEIKSVTPAHTIEEEEEEYSRVHTCRESVCGERHVPGVCRACEHLYPCSMTNRGRAFKRKQTCSTIVQPPPPTTPTVKHLYIRYFYIGQGWGSRYMVWVHFAIKNPPTVKYLYIRYFTWFKFGNLDILYGEDLVHNKLLTGLGLVFHQ